MSKIYDKYLELKEQEKEKMYLFRCGNFYIFLAEDADEINNYVVLKRTKFTKEVLKCGFPIISKEEYMKVFKNHSLEVEIIENPTLPLELSEREHRVIEIIKTLEMNEMTPMESMNKLKELQGMCYE